MKKTKKIVSLIFLPIILVLATILTVVIFSENAGVRRGDVNGDGRVDARDLILLQQYLAGYDFDSNMAAFSVEAGADVNGDGKISLKDVLELRKYLAGVDGDGFFEIVEENGMSQVVGRDGLEYTVAGYSRLDADRFVFNQGLEITFGDDLFAAEFNRVCFDYEATEPIKMYVTYTLDGEEKTDSFFLEATKTSFRGLIEGYLADKKGIALKKLTVDTCENVEARFILHDLTTEVIPLYADDLTVENDRYKVGCRLSWGGAMTYFEDKLDGDDTLGNLVNIHDTGRLIQQSFYGTYTNDEYTSGYNSSNKLWPYNPVQGGDMKNNGSTRLVDIEVGEDYIWILAQPLDWANPLYVTPMYYENRYTVKKDHVVVDNVATDFSGWDHPAGGQEIPAVYLVSYFDTLSYYNGIKPWTGDEEGVMYEADLEGWSNAGSFPLYRGNTETWSIWINTEDNFGFGTYCPNIQKHIAIRHQYNGSKDPMNNSTSYVAPSCSIVMQSYVPIEYSYILATGDPEDIRDVFEENKDFTDNASLSNNRYDQLIYHGKFDMMNMDFTVPENAYLFHSARHLETSYDSVEEALKFNIVNGSDPYASLSFDWNSDKVISSLDFNTIEIEYMLPETNSKEKDHLLLFLCAGDVTSYSESYTVMGNIVRDGEYHTLSIRVPKDKCQGDLHSMRFDVFTQAAKGDVMYVKRIVLKTFEYPDIGIDNDMSVPGCETLPIATNCTNVYYDESEKAVALKTEGGTDVNVTFGFGLLGLSTVRYKTMEIEYMIPTTNAKKEYSSSVYFKTSDYTSFEGSRSVSAGSLVVDGQYHTMTFDFTKKAEYWTGDITEIRFDYFQNAPLEGDVIYIKRIRFIGVEGHEIELYADSNGSCFSKTNHTSVRFDDTEGALVLERTGGSDVGVVIDLSESKLNASDYSKFLVKYMIPTDNSKSKYSSALYYVTDEHTDFGESQSVYVSLIADGKYHTAVFDFSDKSTWSGNIDELRFDYFQASSEVGDLVYIESIILIK